MLEVEIEALGHLIRVLNGDDAYFQALKLQPEDITRIMEGSFLQRIPAFRVLGLLFELRDSINKDAKFNKLLKSNLEKEESFLFEDLTIEPSTVLANYIKNVTNIIKDHPDVFLAVPEVSEDDDEDLSSEMAGFGVSQSLSVSGNPSTSPTRVSSAFTRKLSNLKLKRTSTKSLSSVQSSTMSTETVQTRQTSVHSIPMEKYQEVQIDYMKSSQININLNSIVKNILFQFLKLFRNIATIEKKYQTCGSKNGISFLKQSVNDSLVVVIYNMLTEYSLKMLDNEMFDINSQILKV